MRRTWLWACLLGCGASAPPADTTPEPDLAEEFVELAESGCACESAECLGDAHGRLEALLERMGGFDEAPSAVHASHREFDACWRAGTEDMDRDLDALTEAVCTCFEAECWHAFEDEARSFTDRYGVDPLEDELAAEEAETVQRLRDCAEERAIDGPTYLTFVETHRERVCECQSLQCYRRASEAFRERTEGKLHVTERDTVAEELREAQGGVCACFGRILAHEMGQVAGQIAPNLQLEGSVDIECDTGGPAE